MEKIKTKQKQKDSYIYTILFVLTISSFSLADNVENSSSIGLRLTTLLFFINLLFFRRTRKSLEQVYNQKIKSLISTSFSIWFFLHCFLYVHPDIGENIIILIEKIGFNIQSYRLNYKTYSFFLANIFCLVVSIIEIKDCGKSDEATKAAYIVGIVFTSYIIINYLFIHIELLTIN